MSTFRNALSPDQSFPPQPDHNSSEHPRIFKTTVVNSRDNPSKPKKFASVFDKLWTALKQPRSILSKHLNVKKHFKKLRSRRKKTLATSLEDSASSPELVDTGVVVEANSVATPATEEPDSEPRRPPELPVAVMEPTESSLSLSSPSEAGQISFQSPDIHHLTGSSISLSSQPDVRRSSSQSPDIHHPHNSTPRFQDQFTPSSPSTAPFSSEASTLHNSTHVNDDLSGHASESPTPSIPEPDPFPSAVTNPTTPHPHLPLQHTRPHAPRIQTDLDHLYVPGSEDENSHSTIRERNSSPASPADFHGVGGLFEDSLSQQGRYA